MLSNQKVRIKCKELVRKVSIFRDKMAVMLGERILVYVSVTLEDNNAMKYKLYKKFFKKI
jgi:intraflagellar transport protein 122